MYEGYVSHLVITGPLAMPYVRHAYVLLPLVMPYVRYMHLGLYIGVNLKGRTTHIWSFGCSFACAIGMLWAQTIIWYNYSFIVIDYH